MKQPKPITIDFETLPIEGRPHYPPPPVGVSIKPWGKRARYYAWGHLTGNNCTWGNARDALVAVWGHSDGLLFHNNKFDVDVAEVHMDLTPPAWDRMHDTMLMLFLDDPNQIELGLKPSAERLLDIAPEERDAVVDWLLENQPVPGTRLTAGKGGERYAGAYIAMAPGELVGKYANGDVDRTEFLFKKIWSSLHDRSMLEAYDRERRLSPILLEMERRGLPVALDRLRVDVAHYNSWRTKIEAWILKRLKVPTLNLDSGVQLMEAMIAANVVDLSVAPLTKTGKYATNKEALLLAVTERVLLGMLNYRSKLKTSLGTFMEPWLQTAEDSGGLIYTTWNQTKSSDGAGAIGTRTGRLSSTPNFQNLPKEFSAIWRHEEANLLVAKQLPVCPLKELPSLPNLRHYIIPFAGHVLVDRDYSQQEPRILAHFDGGQLMQQYVDEPWTDLHDYARDALAIAGRIYTRKAVKGTNLGLIYGMGIGKLADKTGLSVDETKALKAAILALYPGLKEMGQLMKTRAQANEPIHTWGGREYYCEPPKLVDGRLKTYDYKMVNTLIQGSAADCTKEAIIRWDAARREDWGKRQHWWLLLNVHDQLTVSVPVKHTDEAMAVLKSSMESVDFDVPMLSEGSTSVVSWGELVDYDKKGIKL